GINCQIVVQSAAQLADRYPVKEWQELVGNCDTQLFLGCNDEMTAEFISKRCGQITIQLTNSMAPQTPLFSPILHSSRPYSQTKSNSTRPLMYPDEIFRLDNRESLILIRGQKPLKAFKIIPEELAEFKKLRHVKSMAYIPRWRKFEEEQDALADLEDEVPDELVMASVEVSAPEPADESDPFITLPKSSYNYEIEKNNVFGGNNHEHKGI
ncbi:MAG: type IV secretory system conjugative DNA transfer family protein, partial [Oscillospiraceae bacterium]|nr:type IV secretory system conjugative DNA transfer family protein [Oscillospiraceae bacterium]